MSVGRLIYVIGPSGAGKNSIIVAAREKLNKIKYLYFAHRYVTRTLNSDEDDVPISTTAFAHYRQNGLLALDWQAHGIRYGIGVFIDGLLRSGGTVVVNGSRAYLPSALSRYPKLTAVLITVPPQVAHARLLARGREPAAAIAARLERALALAIPTAQLVTIDNSGALEQATQAMISVLRGGGRGGVAG
jgi:ribose 1,5-bisphosphokinase